MLRSKNCIRPHRVIVIHRLAGRLSSCGFVLIETEEVVDVFARFLALKDSIADVLDNLVVRNLLTRLGQEIGAVADSEAVKTEPFDGFNPFAFRPDVPQTALDQSFDDMVVHNRRSTKSHSGIWRDLAVRKRKTEAEAQLGPIIKVGQKNGIATPLTSRLMAMVLEIEAGDRRLGVKNLEELTKF